MNNKEYWDKLSKPPISALKKIGGGRLSGMTDINPQWRYEAMTDVFGVCGMGWKYTIDKLWSENGSEGQIFCFAMVTVYINHNGLWSDGIPASGGSMLVEKETKGLHSSDEGYKMATTDALGTAMKMLGVASEIYSGRWDGAKYKDKPEEKLASMKTIVANDLADASDEDRARLALAADKLSYLFELGEYDMAIGLIKAATNGDPTQVNIIRGLGDTAHWKALGVYRAKLKADATKLAQAEAVRRMNSEPVLGGAAPF